jgi:hypothetical protein
LLARLGLYPRIIKEQLALFVLSTDPHRLIIIEEANRNCFLQHAILWVDTHCLGNFLLRGWWTRIPSGRLSLAFFHQWLTRRTQLYPCDVEFLALHSLELLCEELRELTLQLLLVLHYQFDLFHHLLATLAALTIQLSYLC